MSGGWKNGKKKNPQKNNTPPTGGSYIRGEQEGGPSRATEEVAASLPLGKFYRGEGVQEGGVATG